MWNALKRCYQPIANTAKRHTLHCSLKAAGRGLGTLALTKCCWLLQWGNGRTHHRARRKKQRQTQKKMRACSTCFPLNFTLENIFGSASSCLCLTWSTDSPLRIPLINTCRRLCIFGWDLIQSTTLQWSCINNYWHGFKSGLFLYTVWTTWRM